MDYPCVASSNGARSGNTLHSSQSIYCNIVNNKEAPLPELPPTSSMTMKAFPGNGIWGHEGCQPQSIYCNIVDNKEATLPEVPPTSSMTMKPFPGNGIWGHEGCQPESIYCNIVDNKEAPLPELPPTFSMTMKPFPGNGIWGHEGCQPPSQYAQGLVGVFLLALNTLKVEKIMPSEANITSCIRYGDPTYRNIDVKMVLECALEQQMIVMQNLGDMQLYIGRPERLWKCVNPTGGTTKNYPKAVWEAIQKVLRFSSGRSAMMASESRYDAALTFRNACLKDLALGEVLQILDMIITMKRWITLPKSGWQRITMNIAETYSD